MFGAILYRGTELVGELVVFSRGFATHDGASDRVCDYSSCLRFSEEFRRSANEVEGCAVNVEEVRGWIEGSEGAVYVEGV